MVDTAAPGPASSSTGRGAPARLAERLRVDPRRLESVDPGLLDAIDARLAELEAERDRLEQLACLDELTGALRRGAGLEAIDRELARCAREGRPISLVMVDIDGLKPINDSEGHAAGDELLCELVGTMRERLRSHDLVLRLGGDEFACALPGSDEEQAVRAGAEIARRFARRSQGRQFTYGVAAAVPGDTAADLVARADAALLGKRRGSRTG